MPYRGDSSNGVSLAASHYALPLVGHAHINSVEAGARSDKKAFEIVVAPIEIRCGRRNVNHSETVESAYGLVARPLRLGVIALVIGLCGVALAFATNYGPGNPLSWVAFSLVALAVLLGFVSVAWGWLSIYRHYRRPPRSDEQAL